VLVVGVEMGDNGTSRTVSGITYNGDALTHISGFPQGTNGASQVSVDMWYIVAPATGTHDVVVTLSGAAGDCDGCSVSVTGATKIGAATTATASDNAPTVTIAAASDDLVFAVGAQVFSSTTPTWTIGNGTSRQNVAGAAGDKKAASTAPWVSGTTVILNWSSNKSSLWRMGGVAIKGPTVAAIVPGAVAGVAVAGNLAVFAPAAIVPGAVAGVAVAGNLAVSAPSVGGSEFRRARRGRTY
jgi:hypothetical protein